MSQSNISNTDLIQINNLDEEENSSNDAGSRESDPNLQINYLDEENSSSPLELNLYFRIVNELNGVYDTNGSNASNVSPRSTQGSLLGARTTYSPTAPVDSPIIPVLPRRLNRVMGGFRGLQNTEDDQESLDREDLSDRDDFEEEPRSAVVIGRNHPASSQAALAGYRYRTWS